MWRALGRFAKARSATSAVEFALVLPLLLVLMFGSFEVSRYLRYSRHIAASADTVASLVSQRTQATDTDLVVDTSSVGQVFRELTLDSLNAGYGISWWYFIGSQVTQVVFTPTVAGCTSGCTYVAKVGWVWTVNPSTLGSMKRSCGTLTGVAAGVAPSGSTIPQALIGPGSVIVSDIIYNYKPLLGQAFVPSVGIVKQAFYAPRFATSVAPVVNAWDTPRLIVCP